MIDHYPTRKVSEETIMKRNEPWLHASNGSLNVDQRRQYAEAGYLVVRDFIKPALLDNLFDFAMQNYSDPQFYTSLEPETKKVRSLLGFHKQGYAKELCESDRLNGIVHEVVGSDTYVHQSRINYKQGMESNGWKWHSDFETWHYQDGMPGMRCVSAMFALEDNTLTNGPLMILNGSHKEFVACPKSKVNSSAEENFADQKEGIPSEHAIKHFLDNPYNRIDTLVCRAGDLVLFDCNVLHVSNPNVTPYGRANMFFVFNSVDNRLVEPYSGMTPRPNEMGERQ